MNDYLLRWCSYWQRYEEKTPPLVIFVGRDGTAYLASDFWKLLRQKRLGKPPRRKAVRPPHPKRVRVPLPKPTHEAPRRAQ